MRKLLATLALCAALGGCGLFEPDVLMLSDGQVSLIASKVGAYSDANKDAWIRETGALLNDTVSKVEKTTAGLQVTLIPAVEQAVKEAPASTGLVGLPEPYNTLINLLIGAIGYGGTVATVSKRRKKAAAKTAAKVPA
jgi:hypothetical protein